MPFPTSPPEPRPQPPASARPSPTTRRPTRRRPAPTTAPIEAAPSLPTTAPSPAEADPDDPYPGWAIADLVAAGVVEAVPGDPPVPVSVWRATAAEAALPVASLHRGLSPTLAARLLAIYTDPGQTVIDTTDDPAVAGAAGAGARRYLSTTLLEPTRRPEPHSEVGLILLRWPLAQPTAAPRWRQDARSPAPQAILRTCAALLSAEGHTVVILAPPDAGTYRDHARTLIPAARRAGLGYLQHLVVITIQSEQPLPTPTGSTEASLPAAVAAGGESARAHEHLDLLVFVLRQSRFGDDRRSGGPA
jgi:hypothetical protein